MGHVYFKMGKLDIFIFGFLAPVKLGVLDCELFCVCMCMYVCHFFYNNFE